MGQERGSGWGNGADSAGKNRGKTGDPVPAPKSAVDNRGKMWKKGLIYPQFFPAKAGEFVPDGYDFHAFHSPYYDVRRIRLYNS